MENFKPQKGLIDSNGVLLKTPGMLRHEQTEQGSKEAVNEETTTEGLLDRSKLIKEKAPKLYQELLRAEEREEKLDLIRRKLEKVTDAIGHPIEPGIKETVVMFNAFELPTTQSCEGHIDSHTEEYFPAMAPWVEIYPEEPEQEGWQYDDKLRGGVEVESEGYLAKVVSLLDEFYKDHQVPADVKLAISPIAYGFRVQSSGLESLQDPHDENQREKAKRYTEEMERFTSFLKDKFKK